MRREPCRLRSNQICGEPRLRGAAFWADRRVVRWRAGERLVVLPCAFEWIGALDPRPSRFGDSARGH